VYWQPVYAVLETALSDSMHLELIRKKKRVEEKDVSRYK
jgi:hypothetical protein